MTIFWARRLPNGLVVVHGRNMLAGHPSQARIAATLDGKQLRWEPDHNGNAQVPSEHNWALGECLLFDARGVDGEELTITRDDGRQASVMLDDLAWKTTRFDDLAGRWDGTKGISVLGSFDGVNRTIEVGRGFVGTSALRIRGGVISNLRIVIHDDAPEGLTAIEIDQEPGESVYLDNVRITNHANRGCGIYLKRCNGGFFSRCDVRADYGYHAPPMVNQHQYHSRNNFLHCRYKGLASRPYIGQAGRAILGDQNAALWCRWRRCDRGIFASEAGPPMFRSLLYRCRQKNTGTTPGGSEGILWEASGDPSKPGTLREFPIANGLTPAMADARAGLFVFPSDNRSDYRRIIAATREGQDWRIQLDRSYNGWAYIGQAAVENSVLNGFFQDGKNAVWFGGRSVGNRIEGGECRDVRDCVVEIVNPDATQVCHFAANYLAERHRFRTYGESRRYVRLAKYIDHARQPWQAQLPWLGWGRE